jgi:hypothetical protein
LPDEQIVRSEGIGLVRLTLETLDERSRELIRLKFTENLSYKEISERTGLKTGHVGYLLHHALKDHGRRTGQERSCAMTPICRRSPRRTRSQSDGPVAGRIVRRRSRPHARVDRQATPNWRQLQERLS